MISEPCPTAPAPTTLAPRTASIFGFIRRPSLVFKFLASGLLFFALLLSAAPAIPADVTLAWDPNTEPDLEGYGLYFKKGAPGPPYDLFGYVTLPELDDPDFPTFTLTGLQDGSTYYFTLTAYDTAGAESGYADPVCAQVGEQIVPCPAAGSGSSGSSGGGSGGGGGACFIGALGFF